MVRAALVLGMFAACSGSGSQTPIDGDVADDVASDATDASGTIDAPGATFTATPPAVTFNATVSTTARDTVTFTNTGGSASAAVTVALGGANPSLFTIESSTCTGALGAGASCTAHVAFTPTAAGTFAATLTLADGGVSATATLTGFASTTLGLAISPSLVDAGAACLATTGSYYAVTVTNQGAAPTAALAVSVVGTQSGEFTIANNSCAGAILPAQGTCSFSVGVRPTGVGTRTASVRVTNPATSNEVGATLTGTGLSCSGLTITPSSYDFGTVNVGDSAFAHQFTLTNTAGSPTGTIATTTGGTNVGDFLKMADNCNGHTLAPGASCTLFVAFEPGAAGPRTAHVTATAAPGGTVDASLSGTGH